MPKRSKELDARFKKAMGRLSHAEQLDVERYVTEQVRTALHTLVKASDSDENRRDELRRRADAIDFARRMAEGIDPTPSR